jgi:hypothetical protein
MQKWLMFFLTEMEDSEGLVIDLHRDLLRPRLEVDLAG